MNLLQVMVAVSSAVVLATSGFAEDSPEPGGTAATQSSEDAARSAVDIALKELQTVLGNADLSDELRLASIEEIVRNRFDMANSARIALGKNRSRFSPPQAASYSCEFESYLSNYIGRRLDRYQKEEIEFLSATRRKSHVIVSTRIVGGKYDRAVVDFRMRKSDGQWRAIDIVFEGISVVRLMREQFLEVLSDGGPEWLLEKLAEKNGPRSDC